MRDARTRENCEERIHVPHFDEEEEEEAALVICGGTVELTAQSVNIRFHWITYIFSTLYFFQPPFVRTVSIPFPLDPWKATVSHYCTIHLGIIPRFIKHMIPVISHTGSPEHLREPQRLRNLLFRGSIVSTFRQADYKLANLELCISDG